MECGKVGEDNRVLFLNFSFLMIARTVYTKYTKYAKYTKFYYKIIFKHAVFTVL
ncbi:hypothetical protein [Methanocella sp. MCL-LM]|uniref:hypothetical protein n=1 Tax=Methanocella sp. MCL-LM TaxID=3412035 RepID=UPI003C70F8A2